MTPSVWREKYTKKDGTIVHRVRWRNDDGKKRSKTAGERAGRASFLEQKTREKLWDSSVGITRAITWPEFAVEHEEYSKVHTRANNHSNFTMPALKSFGAHIGNKILGRISLADAEAWKLKQFKEGYAVSTVRGRADALNAAFNRAKKLKYTAENPFEGLEMPEETGGGRALPEHEVALMLEAALALDCEPFYRSFGFGTVSGFRPAEILVIDWDIHVVKEKDRETGDLIEVIKLPKELRKTKKPCVVPVTPKMRHFMGPRGHGRAFPYTRGILQKQIRRVVAQVRKTYPLPRTTFYDSRHTFATNYLVKGRESELIEMKLWLDYGSLKRYHHPSLSTLRARMSEIPCRLPHGRPKSEEPPTGAAG